MNSVEKTARISGLWFASMAISTAICMSNVDSSIFYTGKGIDLIVSNKISVALLGVGFLSNILGLISFVFLYNPLYRLMGIVDKDSSKLIIIFLIAGLSVACINLINQVGGIVLLFGEQYLHQSGTAKLRSMVVIFMNLYRNGGYISAFFWGIWLFPFGFLFFNYWSKASTLSFFLIIGCIGYFISSTVLLFFPDYHVLTYNGLLIANLGLVLSTFWLLFSNYVRVKVTSGVTDCSV